MKYKWLCLHSRQIYGLNICSFLSYYHNSIGNSVHHSSTRNFIISASVSVYFARIKKFRTRIPKFIVIVIVLVRVKYWNTFISAFTNIVAWRCDCVLFLFNRREKWTVNSNRENCDFRVFLLHYIRKTNKNPLNQSDPKLNFIKIPFLLRRGCITRKKR